jgi:hypothetical protein
MLYLLGGASRAGKSQLTRRLLRERGIPYFPLDSLMMGFVNGLPEFGMPAGDPAAVGARLWPLVRALAASLLSSDETYLLEGDCLLPQYVAELVRDHHDQVRACWLGYTAVAPDEKLRVICASHSGPNDWLRADPDAAVLALIGSMIAFSQDLERECAARSLPYFDTSRDFLGAQDAAFRYLIAP